MSSPLVRTYTVARAFRVLHLASSLILLAAGVGALVLPLVVPGWMPRSPGDLATVCAAALVLGGLGAFGLHQAEDIAHYAFTVTPEGFRMDDRSATHRAAWHEIVTLRERRVLQRVELLDTGGRLRGRLGFQTARFEEALAAVLRGVPDREPVPVLPHALVPARWGWTRPLTLERDALVLGCGPRAERIGFDAIRFAVVGRRSEPRQAGLQLVLGLADGSARCLNAGAIGAIGAHRALVRACPRLAGEDTTRELWATEFDRKAS